MNKQPTVHNPTNFDPQDYEVLDYLDGKRPAYYGQGLPAYEAEVAFWEQEMVAAFGPDWKTKNVRKCVHCGHNPLRWLTVTLHKPTDATVTFGSDCTKRLAFVDQKTFKLAQLQAKDAANKVKIKVWNERQAFLAAHPDFAKAVATINDPIHSKNGFAHDVYSKLGQYGSLSDKQVSAVIASLARDKAKAAAPVVAEVKGPAPSGRQTVTGVVLNTKQQASDFVPGGWVKKMLLQLANGSKVWLTVPSKATVERGMTVVVTATFTPSKDDASFSFGAHPVLVSSTATVTV
jgi:hypothetical protein